MLDDEDAIASPIILASEEVTERLGQALAKVVQPGTVIALIGGLGAGKTRLVRSISEALGVDPAAISSPTFVLIHEYEGRIPIYHFDVYRLKNLAEFEDLGPTDYWDVGGLCLVEWADRVPGLMPSDAWTITIEQVPEYGPSVRRVQITPAAVRDEVLRSFA
jgi:tRNA threonylcarbamoyladenosine biosynthesis protein TsaE